MSTRDRVPTAYTRAELLSDAAVHVTGIAVSIVAVPVLITFAAIWIGDAGTVIAAVVYGGSLLAMFVGLRRQQHDPRAGAQGPAAPHRPVGHLRQDRRQLHAAGGADRHPCRALPRQPLGRGAGRRVAAHVQPRPAEMGLDLPLPRHRLGGGALRRPADRGADPDRLRADPRRRPPLHRSASSSSSGSGCPSTTPSGTSSCWPRPTCSTPPCWSSSPSAPWPDAAGLAPHPGECATRAIGLSFPAVDGISARNGSWRSSTISSASTILVGSGGVDFIFGRGGDDLILAGGGNDIIDGGDGNDTIYGEDGLDQIKAGRGNDTVWGGNHSDTVLGESGADKLHGESGSDVLFGRLGQRHGSGATAATTSCTARPATTRSTAAPASTTSTAGTATTSCPAATATTTSPAAAARDTFVFSPATTTTGSRTSTPTATGSTSAPSA